MTGKGLLRKAVEKYKSSNIMYRAGIWFVLVTVIDQAISLLTQPVLNRILSVEDIGLYSVYNTWTSITSVVVTCNLFCGVLEVYVTKYKDDIKQVVGSLMTLMFVLSTAFFVVGGVFLPQISAWTGIKPIYWVMMMINNVANAVVQFWCVPKRFEYKYKPYAIVYISLFAAKCTLSVAFSYLIKTDRVFGRILGLVLPTTIVAICLFIRMIRGVRFERITQYWKTALAYNIPLIPHYLSSIFLASSDRIMIQKMCGEYEAGLYSIAHSYAALALIIFGALNSSYTPYAYDAINKKEYSSLPKKTQIIIAISVLFSLGLMIAAPEGLWILGGKRYLSTLDVIPVLIIGTFLSSFYFIFSNVEFVYEETKYMFLITVIGAGVNILLNYFLIPIYGYKAAAYTTIIGYVIIACMHGVISHKLVGKDIYGMKRILGLILALFIGGYLITVLYQMHFLIRYGIVLVAALIAGTVMIRKIKGE